MAVRGRASLNTYIIEEFSAEEAVLGYFADDCPDMLIFTGEDDEFSQAFYFDDVDFYGVLD